MPLDDNNIKFKAPSLPQNPTQMGQGAPAMQQTVTPTSVPSVAAAGSSTEGISTGGLSSVQPSSQQGKYDNNFAADLKLPPKVLQTKFFVILLLCVFLFGSFLGCSMSSGKSKPQQQAAGLQGVVFNANPFIQNAARCGRTDVNRACVLYIMNAKPYERWGRDFFEEAANIVGVQPYLVRINNVEYQNKLIGPGLIAQIYIPARR